MTGERGVTSLLFIIRFLHWPDDDDIKIPLVYTDTIGDLSLHSLVLAWVLSSLTLPSSYTTSFCCYLKMCKSNVHSFIQHQHTMKNLFSLFIWILSSSLYTNPSFCLFTKWLKLIHFMCNIRLFITNQVLIWMRIDCLYTFD
jgi:hypothetical protein